MFSMSQAGITADDHGMICTGEEPDDIGSREAVFPTVCSENVRSAHILLHSVDPRLA